MTPLNSITIIFELKLSRFDRFSIRSTSKPCALPSRINSKGLKVGELPHVSLPGSTVLGSSAYAGEVRKTMATASTLRSMVIDSPLDPLSCDVLEILVRRPHKAQMITQRSFAMVVRAKENAALQFRHAPPNP